MKQEKIHWLGEQSLNCTSATADHEFRFYSHTVQKNFPFATRSLISTAAPAAAASCQ